MAPQHWSPSPKNLKYDKSTGRHPAFCVNVSSPGDSGTPSCTVRLWARTRRLPRRVRAQQLSANLNRQRDARANDGRNESIMKELWIADNSTLDPAKPSRLNPDFPFHPKYSRPSDKVKQLRTLFHASITSLSQYGAPPLTFVHSHCIYTALDPHM